MAQFTMQFGAIIDLSDPDRAVAVVDDSGYQARLRKFDSGRLDLGECVKFTAGLVPEAGNANDPNAIMVTADVSSEEDFAQIGRLSRGDSARYRRVIADIFQRGWFPYCEGRLVGRLVGGKSDAPQIGALLFLADTKECRRIVLEKQAELRAAELASAVAHAERLPEPRDGWIDLTGRRGNVSLVGNRRCREALSSLGASLPRDSSFKVALRVDSAGAVVAATLDGDVVGRMSNASGAQYRDSLMRLQTAPIRAMCDARLRGGTAIDPELNVRLALLPPDTCSRAAAAVLSDIDPPQVHARLF